jgi:serine/threonine protein kinase
LPELSTEKKRRRSNGEFTKKGPVYMLTMTTLGWSRPISDLSEVEMKAAVHAILHALVRLHSNGLVHRDLRLDNVLWRPHGGGPFLTDLELAAQNNKKVILSQIFELI